jgi:hypothetical protein
MRRGDAHKSGHPFVTVFVVRLGCIEEILESNVIGTFLKKNNVQQDVQVRKGLTLRARSPQKPILVYGALTIAALTTVPASPRYELN